MGQQKILLSIYVYWFEFSYIRIFYIYIWAIYIFFCAISFSRISLKPSFFKSNRLTSPVLSSSCDSASNESTLTSFGVIFLIWAKKLKNCQKTFSAKKAKIRPKIAVFSLCAKSPQKILGAKNRKVFRKNLSKKFFAKNEIFGV